MLGQQAPVQYQDAVPRVGEFWYLGSDELKVGYPLCWVPDTDYNSDGEQKSTSLAAANVNKARGLIVEKPDANNIYQFAGVVAPGQTLKASEFPGPVKLIRPGSVAKVWTNLNCTAGVTRMTVMADQYRMSGPGLPGEGTAIALQTVDRSTTAGYVQAYLEEGEPSGGYCEIDSLDANLTTAMNLLLDKVATVKLTTTTLGADRTATLADGTFNGQKKRIVMKNAPVNEIAVTITSHITSDPEVLFFGKVAAGEYACLEWFDNEWIDLGTTAATAT